MVTGESRSEGRGNGGEQEGERGGVVYNRGEGGRERGGGGGGSSGERGGKGGRTGRGTWQGSVMVVEPLNKGHLLMH